MLLRALLSWGRVHDLSAFATAAGLKAESTERKWNAPGALCVLHRVYWRCCTRAAQSRNTCADAYSNRDCH